MCGGTQGFYRGDEQSASIIKLLSNFKYDNVGFFTQNIYFYGVSPSTTEDELINARNLVNAHRRVFNLVNPPLELTYLLVKRHFTPYVDGDDIIWYYW